MHGVNTTNTLRATSVSRNCFFRSFISRSATVSENNTLTHVHGGFNLWMGRNINDGVSLGRLAASGIFSGFDTLLPSGGRISGARYARATSPAPIFEGDTKNRYRHVATNKPRESATTQKLCLWCVQPVASCSLLSRWLKRRESVRLLKVEQRSPS